MKTTDLNAVFVRNMFALRIVLNMEIICVKKEAENLNVKEVARSYRCTLKRQ
jgi:hypothetical protein